MPLSSQIVELATSEPTRGQLGRVEALRRALRTGPNGPRMGGTATTTFLDDISQRPPWQPVVYTHPEQNAASAVRRRQVRDDVTGTMRPEPLSATDAVWLQRVPQDPAQVPFDDAIQLARLAASFTDKGSSDGRLVWSVWEPVKHVHDTAAAEADLRAAERPYPPVPPSVHEALQDAIAAEVPQLRPDEVRLRADAMLVDALRERDAARQERIDDARARLASLRAAREQRLAVTR